MKKKITLMLALVAIASGALAQAATAAKANKDFDIFIDQKTALKSVDNVELNGFITNYAFSDPGKTFMLMYILLPRSENAIDYTTESIYLLLETFLGRIAGKDLVYEQISKYPKSEVAALTNGDIGISTFFANRAADAGGRFEYELINVFYKKDYGLVCQIVAAKKLDFFKTGTYVSALQSFKFPGIQSK